MQIPLALPPFSSVNDAVMRRALPVFVGIIALALPLSAQDHSGVDTITREDLDHTGAVDAGSALSLARPDLFSRSDSAALVHGLPVLTLLDGRRFPVTELGRMGMTTLDVVPVGFLRAVEVQKAGSLRHGADTTTGVVNLVTNRIYTGGEVGVFYGKSTGKYGREEFSTYLVGGVGNEKFNITAGVSYTEVDEKIPRRRFRD